MFQSTWPPNGMFQRFGSISAVPHRAGLRGHGAAAPPVGQRLGEDDGLSVRPGPVRPLPGLHRVPHHHLEEEPHEV